MPAVARQIYTPQPSSSDMAVPGFMPSVFVATPFAVTKDGVPLTKDGKSVITAPKLEVAETVTLHFPAGQYVPNAPANKKWLEPYGTLTGKHGYPLLYTYSLIIALVCGTAGLPHILVRFYTNPDGRSAKRTTFWVMVLLGAFYVFTPMWGALGRDLLPSLYANNKTDAVVIALPRILENKVLGEVLAGITSAGAFAAFMSTFSGLLVSMSGALAHDIYGKMIKPTASSGERLTAFKIAAIVFGFISMGLGLLVESFDITLLVGWAFAIAAASYFPLLLLGAWWRGLTRFGAAAGMLIGGTASLFAIITFMGIEKKWLPLEVSPLTKALLEQPAIWGVPLSLFIMYVVSKATAKSLPADLNAKMLRLHAPEEMGISKNYVD
jgi:Na+(H+)/acetate symporter ActP